MIYPTVAIREARKCNSSAGICILKKKENWMLSEQIAILPQNIVDNFNGRQEA